jgi:hypothetical protein
MGLSIVSVSLGTLLILIGIWMAIHQFRRTSLENAVYRTIDIGRSGVSLKTTYPGIILIAIGAVMVIVGTATGQ